MESQHRSERGEVANEADPMTDSEDLPGAKVGSQYGAATLARRGEGGKDS